MSIKELISDSLTGHKNRDISFIIIVVVFKFRLSMDVLDGLYLQIDKM
jgi:hypothetical protein